MIYDNGLGGGSGINCDGVQNSVIRNNIIYNEHASGISLYQIDGGDSSKNNLVVNNTVLVASNGRWGLNISDGSTGNTVRNNIFYSYHSFRGSLSVNSDSLAGFTSDYNVVMDRFTTDGGDSVLTLANWRSHTGQDMHSLDRHGELSFSSTRPAAICICRRQARRSTRELRSLHRPSISKAPRGPAATALTSARMNSAIPRRP